MARFYTEINKVDFLKKVEELLNNDDSEFPHDLPTKIADDLKKVNFDWENYTRFDETSGYACYPVGHREPVKNFHMFFVNAGGDWEFPICFILYWNNGLRAYIPKDGNAWNKKEKCAYGSEDLSLEEMEKYDMDPEDIDKQVDESKMINEIINHITKK
jgi:hypothetical protein